MPQVDLSIRFEKNTGLMYSASELTQLYFFGIPLTDPNGNTIPPETIEHYIKVAQQEIEHLLSIKLNRMVYEESKHYRYDEWVKWNYISTGYPVVKPLSLKGFINTTLQVEYPVQWLSTKTQAPDEFTYFRSVHLVPITGSASSGSGSSNILLGISPYLGYFGNAVVPNYWTVRYQTGFHKVPIDILDAIGKKAAIELFAIVGDIIHGVGISNRSQSIDGLSQSIGTSRSGTTGAFGARIAQYEKEMPNIELRLRRRYLGLVMSAV